MRAGSGRRHRSQRRGGAGGRRGASRARGRPVALLARGRRVSPGAADDVRAAGGSARRSRPTSPTPSGRCAAADRVERELGPIDVWVNVAFTSVFAPFDRDQPGGVPARHRGDLPRLRLRHAGGAARGCCRATAATIVQVGSALAYRGIPLQSAYCGPSTRSRASTSRCAASCCTTAARVRVTMVQLPAVNTPQFDWVLTRLPRQPQPVPPIYQPEVAARAIVYAADHPRRREYWVGGTTAATLIGNAVAPGCSTATWPAPGSTRSRPSEPHAPAAPDEPVGAGGRRDGHDFGAHGRFDDAVDRALLQLWASAAPRAAGRPRRRDRGGRRRCHSTAPALRGMSGRGVESGRGMSGHSRARPVVVVLALVGCAVATVLTPFQVGVLDDVWEPFFGDGSRRVLTSALSRALPVPDAALGAVAYLAEAVLTALGHPGSAQGRPRCRRGRRWARPGRAGTGRAGVPGGRLLHPVPRVGCAVTDHRRARAAGGPSAFERVRSRVG